jgi:hypothetical protein
MRDGGSVGTIEEMEMEEDIDIIPCLLRVSLNLMN